MLINRNVRSVSTSTNRVIKTTPSQQTEKKTRENYISYNAYYFMNKVLF